MKKLGMSRRVLGWETVEESINETIDRKTRMSKFMQKKLEEVISEETVEIIEERISTTVIRRREVK